MDINFLERFIKIIRQQSRKDIEKLECCERMDRKQIKKRLSATSKIISLIGRRDSVNDIYNNLDRLDEAIQKLSKLNELNGNNKKLVNLSVTSQELTTNSDELNTKLLKYLKTIMETVEKNNATIMKTIEE